MLKPFETLMMNLQFLFFFSGMDASCFTMKPHLSLQRLLARSVISDISICCLFNQFLMFLGSLTNETQFIFSLLLTLISKLFFNFPEKSKALSFLFCRLQLSAKWSVWNIKNCLEAHTAKIARTYGRHFYLKIKRKREGKEGNPWTKTWSAFFTTW